MCVCLLWSLYIKAPRRGGHRNNFTNTFLICIHHMDKVSIRRNASQWADSKSVRACAPSDISSMTSNDGVDETLSWTHWTNFNGKECVRRQCRIAAISAFTSSIYSQYSSLSSRALWPSKIWIKHANSSKSSHWMVLYCGKVLTHIKHTNTGNTFPSCPFTIWLSVTQQHRMTQPVYFLSNSLLHLSFLSSK